MDKQDQIDQDDNFDERIERSIDIQNDIDEIREKKKERIKRRMSTDNKKTEYFNGRIKDLEKEDEYIRLKIRYNSKTSWTKLSYPSSTTDYSNDCQYVRYLNYTDALNDDSVIENKIPLKSTGDRVFIHLPDDMSTKTVLKYRLIRYLNITEHKLYTLVKSISSIILTFIGMSIIFTAYNLIGLKFIYDFIILGSFGIVLSLPILLLYISISNGDKFNKKTASAIYSMLGLIFLILTIASGSSIEYIESGVSNSDFLYTFINYSSAMYLFIATYLLSDGLYSRIKNRGKKTISKYKKKYILNNKDPSYID